jgi:hypothetical protein
MSEVYQSLSHSRWDCKYHVIFVPKRRRKVLYGELRRQLGPIFHEQSTVADGLTLGGIGMHLGTVHADVAQLEITGGLSQQQHLDEQLFDLGPERLAEVRQRVVIRMQATRHKPEGQRLVGGLFDLPGTEHAGGVPVEQQGQQEFRRIGFTAAQAVTHIDAGWTDEKRLR